jgi:hypothetical protein
MTATKVMPKSSRPWDSMEARGPDPEGDQAMHGIRYGDKRCQLYNSVACSQSVAAHRVVLLPGVSVALLLCDHHNEFLMRRALEVERLLKAAKER